MNITTQTTYTSSIHSLSKFYGFADGLTWRDHEVTVLADGTVQGLDDADGDGWDLDGPGQVDGARLLGAIW